MAGINSNIQITDLDFNTIKNNLKKFLQSQDTLKDYNYEGSALSTLLDILAYNTQYNAYYLNMVANEMFLDSALLRSSVVSHAKLLNYTPKSASAPSATINLQFHSVTDSSLTLPKFSKFISEAVDGINYTFVTTDNLTVNTDANGNVTYPNLVLKQGQPTSLSFTYVAATNPSSLFEIPDANIDTTSLSVTVQQSSSNTTSLVYNLATDYLSLSSTSAVYFLQEGVNGLYQIYFGDGSLGQALTDGNVVKISYITTKGTAATGANNFVLMDVVSGYSNTSIFPLTSATQGAEKETIDSIKFTAPKAHSAQGRAVTKEDYIYLIQNNAGIFPIDAVNVWGGEENDPPSYGTVFVAIKPKGGYTLTQSQKNIIESKIIKPISVLTIQPKIVDVDYTYLVINSNVLYDPKMTNLTSSQLESLVLTAIQNFGKSTLNTFNSTFQLASLISTVQSVSPSFITNDASVYLQKRFAPSLTSSSSYTFNFGTALKKDVFGKSVKLTPTFQFRDPTNNYNLISDVYLEETPTQSTYLSSITMVNPGFGYTSKPIVKILGDGTGATAEATVVNGQIQSIKVIDGGVGYTQAIIQIISTDGNGTLASALAVLSSNIGTLRTYYFYNGVKTILNSNAGTVNYFTGTINLNNFNPLKINNELGVLTLQVVPDSSIISSSRNKIVTLDNTDPNSVNINLTAK